MRKTRSLSPPPAEKIASPMPASERKGRESGSGSQPPRFAGLAVWCIWIACNRSSERITGHFHEKAGPCQAFFFGRAIRTTDCRPTGGIVSLQSFLHRKVSVRPSRQPIADQREAHNAAIPNFQITDSPYFHPHSLWSYCSGASWVSSIGNGCCRLVAELNVSVSSDVVPGPSRSHPNSAICSKPCQAAIFFCSCRAL